MPCFVSLAKLTHLRTRTVTFRNLTSKMPRIKTFVFLDLETTGLPHLEHNRTKITEFCGVAAQADHIELGCFPRVQNKLSLCFNPEKCISPESTEITGLSNDLLQHQMSFSSDVVDIINKWLEMSQAPICLVAHNGNRFDYPIFRAEVAKTGNHLLSDVLCVDSLAAFKSIDKIQKIENEVKVKKEEVPFEFDEEFDAILSQACDEYERSLKPEDFQKINETTPKKQIISSQGQICGAVSKVQKRHYGHTREFVSYKLADVYSRLTAKSPINAHSAEGDVAMMITCAAMYGEAFVNYANENSVKFDEMPIMRPGRKIGE